MGAPETGTENVAESIFKEMIAGKFLNLMKEMNLYTQEVQQTSIINTKQSTLTHYKLSKTDFLKENVESSKREVAHS
jgi:predicted transcriptional regulator